MYFVDRDELEKRLQYLEGMLEIFEEMKDWTSNIEKLAVERIIHMVIEAMLDVGNSMIDGFIMRDPGSYDDIIDILEDEKVITKEMSACYKRVLSLRKSLVVAYVEINHDELHQTFNGELNMLKRFAPNVRKYLERELGTVTTFK